MKPMHEGKEYDQKLVLEVIKVLDNCRGNRGISVLIYALGAVIANQYDVTEQENIIRSLSDWLKGCVHDMRENKDKENLR